MVDKEDSASLPPGNVQRPDDEAWCRCGHEWTDHQVPRAGSNFSTWCNICGTDCADVQHPTPELLRAASQSAGIFDFASDDDGDDGLDDLIAPTPPLTEEELAVKLAEWNRRPHLLEQSAKEECPTPNEGCSADEELAELEQWGDQFDTPEAFAYAARSEVPRLIADLRASRERIKELEAEVEEWKQAHRSEVGY